VSASLPAGVFNIHWFSFLNAISFQIILGAPVILYAKSIGASSTVIGLLASFAPLMTVLQLPAARFLHLFGYRRFVLAGWGVRTVFIFIIAAVPLMDFLDSNGKIMLMLFLLFVFNILRGAASAAWMPWMASIIPSEARARFLSRDQIFMFVGSLFALLMSSLLMKGHADPHEYAIVFAVSAIAGIGTLHFIKKIPDVHAEEELRHSSVQVPWRAIVFYPPFFALLIFNILFVVVVGSLGVFTVEYLNEFPGFDAARVLYLSGVAFLGSLAALPFLGRVIDEYGSKPVLAGALAVFGLVIGGWFLVAAGVVPCSRRVIAVLNFFSGAAGACFQVANARMAFSTMPLTGRNHFFALFTVITSLGLGAAPVLWGLSLDYIGTFEAVTGIFEWKRHSIYFAALFVLNILTILQVGRLHEGHSQGERLDAIQGSLGA
jgi:MFS family permease